MISGVSYLIILRRTIPILFKHIRSSLACSWFLSLRTVSYFLNLLSVHHSSLIPHLQYSFLYPFPLIFKTKSRPIAPDSLLKTNPFQTVQVSALRHVQAENWHGPPVPLRPWPISSFFVFLVWVILGWFISLGTYTNFGIRASSDSHLNPTLFPA